MMKDYPATLNIKYQQQSNRKTVIFRLILAIPICIILVLLSHHGYNSENGSSNSEWIGLVVAPTLLMIVFRRKYPKWWFDWNLEFTRFSTRVASYILLLRDEYPSTDEEQFVTVNLQYPDVKNDLNQWMPLIKWFLVLPHVFVLLFIFIGVVGCTIIAWFAILFTKTYPKGIFDYVVGALRWSLRVQAYALLLVTDEYPPFRLSA